MESEAQMDRVLEKFKRLRDAFLPELIILLLTVVGIRFNMSNHEVLDTTPWLGQWSGETYHFTPATWYGLSRLRFQDSLLFLHKFPSRL